ncbi:MAG: amino acid ABC transporter permease [Nocardioides sp.]|nr:amino acid ABC transporter permease [Nocardioides sp.]
MSIDSVLYDAPGPKARRRAMIGTVVVVALGLVVVVIAGLRFAERGQFDADLWSPVLNPADEQFSLVWNLLFQGLRATMSAAVLAIVFSLIVGTALGSARMLLGAVPTVGPILKTPIVIFIELFRGLPVVITLFLTYQFFRYIGFRLTFLPGSEIMWYVVIGLTLYNSVVIAEILRAGVASLPSGQAEASRAIGMTEAATMRMVLLPQAFRVMLPALISQLVVIVKDTSLGTFIFYLELLTRGLRISQNLDNPIQMLLVVALLFILVNYALSRLAVWTEHRMSRASPGSAEKTEEATGAVAGA